MAANCNVDVTVLEKRIKEILNGADLEKMTAKVVRKQLENELHVDLIDYKKAISSIIEKVINENDDDGDSSDVDGDDGSVDIKSNVEKYPNDASGDSSSNEDDEKLARKLQEAEENNARRATRSGRNNKSDSSKKQAKVKRKQKKRSSDSESDDEKPKKKPRGGYMKNCQLSQELAAFVGESELPRHAIVKKVWGYVKENNLHDPKNRQFALCDKELMKIFGVKRVRLFGMMKLLQKHIIN